VPGLSGRDLLDPATTATIGFGSTPATFSIAVPANAGPLASIEKKFGAHRCALAAIRSARCPFARLHRRSPRG